MLVDPCRSDLTTFDGTRLLQSTLGIVGAAIMDPCDPERLWTVHSIFAPIPQRMLGGVRVRLVDQKGFTTFINQRDFEVVSGLAEPGNLCVWTGELYVGPDDGDWCGLCMDNEDLRDDLQQRELLIRIAALQTTGSPILARQVIRRLVHKDSSVDEEEQLLLLWDEGYSDLETILDRWKRTDRRRLEWEHLPSV